MQLQGDPFTLPAQAIERAIDAMTEDVAWMEERLGRSLSDFDVKPVKSAPSLEEWRTFSASEVGAMLRVMIESRAHDKRRGN